MPGDKPGPCACQPWALLMSCTQPQSFRSVQAILEGHLPKTPRSWIPSLTASLWLFPEKLISRVAWAACNPQFFLLPESLVPPINSRSVSFSLTESHNPLKSLPKESLQCNLLTLPSEASPYSSCIVAKANTWLHSDSLCS